MSLSQKYSGKALVPWFNTSEWRSVYNLIADNSYEAALNILKIWKSRTPLLSAGIEGTLIILESMCLHEQHLTEIECAQIYSVSLLRFLNICAANNDKQGTFYKSLSKAGLPKWLIDIRHDIAHDNKLPTKYLLEIALKTSLDWILEKYWNVQNDSMCDYVVQEAVDDIEILTCYIRLKNMQYSGISFYLEEEESILKIKQLMQKRYKCDLNADEILNILEEFLNQSFSAGSNTTVVHKISKMLLTANAMLGSCIEESPVDGCRRIKQDVRSCWTNILNIFLRNGFIFTLMHELFKITNNVLCDDATKTISSLWIEEVLNGLIRVQTLKNMANSSSKSKRVSKMNHKISVQEENIYSNDCLEFDVTQIDFTMELDKFQEMVLHEPNIYCSTYLKSLIRLSSGSEEEVETILQIVDVYLHQKTNTWEDGIMTSNNCDSFSDCHRSASQNNGIILNTPNCSVVTTKWEKIQDTHSFQRCPLGVLPHQNRSSNPTLLFLCNK